ncbi:MAG: O-antigen ligase family protein [Desulfobacterales bacterium]|nr:O-antigen ligase family protein [Desulfobacterales bacterium]
MMLSNRMCTSVMYALIGFPLLTNHLRHAGSLFLLIFMILGIYTFFRYYKHIAFTSEEKQIIAVFMSYFAIYMVSFLINSFIGNLQYPRLKYLDHEIRMLFWIPVYVLFSRCKIEEWVLWWGLCIGSVFAGLFACIQTLIVNADGRISGAYHAIAFGDLSLVMGFMGFCGYSYFYEKHPLWRLLPFLSLIGGVSASILSGSRGAWIAIPVLFMILLWQVSGTLKGKTTGILLLGIMLLVIALNKVEIIDRMRISLDELFIYTNGDVEGSVGSRFEMWKAALTLFHQHPFWGIGPGAYQAAIWDMIWKGQFDPKIAIWHQPHSQYLSVMVDCGILGLISLLLIFFVPLFHFVKRIYQHNITQKRVAFAGCIFIAGFMHFGITETIFKRNINIAFYIIMLAIIYSLIQSIPNENTTHINP